MITANFIITFPIFTGVSSLCAENYIFFHFLSPFSRFVSLEQQLRHSGGRSRKENFSLHSENEIFSSSKLCASPKRSWCAGSRRRYIESNFFDSHCCVAFSVIISGQMRRLSTLFLTESRLESQTQFNLTLLPTSQEEVARNKKKEREL